MRLLLLALGTAAAAVALLVWASSRDLREPWSWPVVAEPDPGDDVQSDPYLVSQPIGGM